MQARSVLAQCSLSTRYVAVRQCSARHLSRHGVHGWDEQCVCGLSRLRYTRYNFLLFPSLPLLTTPCLLRSYNALCLCCAHPLVLTNLDAPSLLPLLLFQTMSLIYHMYRTTPPPLPARRLITLPRLLRGGWVGGWREAVLLAGVSYTDHIPCLSRSKCGCPTC